MRPPKLQDPIALQQLVDSYFSEREEQKEIRELKNGDKKIYKTPPTLYGLATHLGITYQCLTEYLNGESEQYSKEIIDILTRTKQRIIEELLDGVSQGIWTEKIVLAMLSRMGVIGDSDSEKTVKIIMQGDKDWSK